MDEDEAMQSIAQETSAKGAGGMFSFVRLSLMIAIAATQLVTLGRLVLTSSRFRELLSDIRYLLGDMVGDFTDQESGLIRPRRRTRTGS